MDGAITQNAPLPDVSCDRNSKDPSAPLKIIKDPNKLCLSGLQLSIFTQLEIKDPMTFKNMYEIILNNMYVFLFLRTFQNKKNSGSGTIYILANLFCVWLHRRPWMLTALLYSICGDSLLWLKCMKKIRLHADTQLGNGGVSIALPGNGGSSYLVLWQNSTSNGFLEASRHVKSEALAMNFSFLVTIKRTSLALRLE